METTNGVNVERDLLPAAVHMMAKHAKGYSGFEPTTWEDNGYPSGELVMIQLGNLAKRFEHDEVVRDAARTFMSSGAILLDDSAFERVVFMAAGAFGSMMLAVGLSLGVGHCIFCNEPVDLEHHDNPAAKILYTAMETIGKEMLKADKEEEQESEEIDE